MQGEKMKAKLIMMIFLLACSTWLIGCEKEGPAERAGENIDEATEQAGERLEESGEEARENANRALERSGDAAEEAGDTIQEKTR
jgi:hypothetical protein